MATKPSVSDTFSNRFYGTVTESGAVTLTFSEINTQVDTFSKRAWILNRLEWYPNVSNLALLLASDDYIDYALCASNKIASLDLNNPAIIDRLHIGADWRTAVGVQIISTPWIRDFSQMPGGGLIINPRPLYLAIKGTSIAGACAAECRGFFTVVDLTPDEYIDMVDFYRILA